MRNKLTPLNTGGGRKPAPPTARVAVHSGDAKLYLSAAAVQMLGAPPKVIVEWEEDNFIGLWITPSTPNDTGAFALSGGGNSMYRVSLSHFVLQQEHPEFIGDYTVAKSKSGILLRKKDS